MHLISTGCKRIGTAVSERVKKQKVHALRVIDF
jgi:hypothetical protein